MSYLYSFSAFYFFCSQHPRPLCRGRFAEICDWWSATWLNFEWNPSCASFSLRSWLQALFEYLGQWIPGALTADGMIRLRLDLSQDWCDSAVSRSVCGRFRILLLNRSSPLPGFIHVASRRQPPAPHRWALLLPLFSSIAVAPRQEPLCGRHGLNDVVLTPSRPLVTANDVGHWDQKHPKVLIVGKKREEFDSHV